MLAPGRFLATLALLVVPVMGGARPVHAQPIERLPTHRITAQAGARMEVTNFWGINARCEVERGFTVSVSALPGKGAVKLAKRSQLIDANWLHSNTNNVGEANALYQRCAGKRFPVIQVYYTARKGVKGEDSLELEAVSANAGRRRAIRVVIAIE